MQRRPLQLSDGFDVGRDKFRSEGRTPGARWEKKGREKGGRTTSREDWEEEEGGKNSNTNKVLKHGEMETSVTWQGLT